ncbi:MAG TPA: hypothetical protein VD866_20095, partial [Urbifossiella sp.]|nr:hypothetical protein [Urbifossiella sp.]
SVDSLQRIVNRATAADALHQAGQRTEAGDYFRTAERLLAERKTGYNQLFSLSGFRFCDWLLAPVERAVWRVVWGYTPPGAEQGEHAAACDEVDRRGTTTLRWATDARLSGIDIGLDHLTLARVGLYRAILAGQLVQPLLDLPHVATALVTLRSTNDFFLLPLGLLTATLYHFVRGDHNRARAYLAETQLIAERGPMPLYLADVHLHRARMFRDKTELKKATKLIRDLGYGRRYEELDDAEKALA